MKGLIFTYVMAYGGAFVSLFNPFVGLLIYVCFAIIRPEALWHWSFAGVGGNFSRIIAAGLLLGWIMQGFGSWKLGQARLIVMALIGYWCWSALGAPLAIADTGKAWYQVEEYAKIVLPFLVGITTIRTTRQLKQLAWVLVLSQGYLAYEFNLIYFTVPDFDPNEWTFAGLDRNGIAITMVASAGFAFFLGLYSPKTWQKLLGMGMAALMVHVVLFSMSRGGMLALVVTGAVTFILVPKRPAYLATALLGLLIGLRLAGPQVVERFNTVFENEKDRDGSAQSRVELWGACVNVMIANPVTGIGSNNWRLVAHEYGFTEGKDAHTMWLHVGAEMGLIGLLLLVTFYGACVIRLWRMRRQVASDADPWPRQYADMVIAAIIGFAISAQFVSVYAVELPFYIVLVGAGALKLHFLAAEEAVSPIPSAQPRRRPAASAPVPQPS